MWEELIILIICVINIILSNNYTYDQKKNFLTIITVGLLCKIMFYYIFTFLIKNILIIFLIWLVIACYIWIFNK